MKKPLIITLVLATLALASSKLVAGPLLVNIRVTAEIQKSSVFVDNNVTNTVSRTNFNEAGVYQFLTNVLSTGPATYRPAFTNPPSLPADGFIVYDPNIAITNVLGLFYVTNKSGFYYPLSGLDTNGNYYSFMELDAADDFLNDQGFSSGFRAVQNGHVLANDTGSVTDTDSAVLAIHNNPYAFNAADNNKPLTDSNTALEIQGNLTLKINATTNEQKVVGTLIGIGSLETVADNYEGVITSARVTLTAPK